MKKVVIIDDEPRARQLLRAMLTDCAPDLVILADCDDLPTGVKAIRKHKPDLVFLDIEMPGHSGLELLDFFGENEIDFFIIFTTAYSQYAIRAFRLSAIDYLLKPLAISALSGAVDRFRNKQEREMGQLAALRFNTFSPTVKRFAIPQLNGIRFINSSELIYAQGEGAYTNLVLASGERVLISRNLKHLELLVDGIPQMIRCHKSYLVNTQFVVAYTRQDGGHLKLSNGHEISVSADKVEVVMAACGR